MHGLENSKRWKRILDTYPYERFGEERPVPSFALFTDQGQPPSFKLLNEEEREKLTKMCIIFGMMHDVDPNIVRPYAKLLIKERRDRLRPSRDADVQNAFREAVGWDEFPRAKGRLMSELKQLGFLIPNGRGR